MATLLNKTTNFLHFCLKLAQRFDEDGCFYRAGALTYTTILSIVPFLAVSFGLLLLFPQFQALGIEVQNFIFKNFMVASGQIIQHYLQQFISQAYHLSLISLVFLVVTAVSMLYTIEQTFNTIWRVHKFHRGILALLWYWILFILSPLLIGIGYAISTYFLSLEWVAKSSEYLGLTRFLLAIPPFLITAFAFSVLYIVVPNCKVPMRNGIIAGIMAAFLFEIAKYGFGLYLTLFPTYELLYGAFAVIPIFLIWIYLVWVIILLGAEISHALSTNLS